MLQLAQQKKIAALKETDQNLDSLELKNESELITADQL
jgi:hypothetical protein